MGKNLIKQIIIMLVCCPYLLNGQSKDVFFLSQDTLSINNQFVIKTKYLCNKDLYIINDTISHIIEVYNGDGMLIKRGFYKVPGDIHSFASIDYNRDGNVEFGTMHFLENYKGEIYSFDTFIYGGNATALYIQTPNGKILAEYRCHNGKWCKHPYHNLHPVKYAKKLLKQYLSLYEQRLQQIENCIWYESK